VRPGEPLLGSVVVRASRARWGFTNETWRVELADGRRVAVQHVANGVASHRGLLQRRLATRFVSAGLPPLPEVLAVSGDRIVTTWIDGRVGSDLLEDEAGPVALASAAGALVPALQRVETEGLDLPSVWASPETLAAVSRGRRAAVARNLSVSARAALTRAIDSLPARYAGRSVGFAHGDLNPTNVLVDAAGRINALLDVEFARVAHPTFDAAWWDWVIRFHYPAAWPALRDAFDAAAGFSATDREDIVALQQLRALELLADATPASQDTWVERVERTAAWI
jgi:aminoglycoside phosphotransferase (APT) family kinase protein